MKYLQCFVIFSFFVSVSKEVWAQESMSNIDMEFGKGTNFSSSDSTFSIKFNGRIQSMFELRQQGDSGTTRADFLLRRARLNFQGTAFDPRFTFRIQLGFALGDINAANSNQQNNLVLRDAMFFYQAKPWLRFGFGQTKLPGNRQRQVSSANLQLVERSIANNNFTLDRDKGLWVYTKVKLKKAILKTTLAVSSGEGRIASSSNGKLSYTGRVEFLPFGNFKNNGEYLEADIEKESKPKLSIAGVYSVNDEATRTMGQLGEYLFNGTEANIRYYGGDLLFKHKGFSLQSELYNRSSRIGIITNTKDSTQKNAINAGTSFLIQSGYFVSNKNEIAIRYASISPSNSVSAILNNQKEFVIGGSHYFSKHALKIQSDVSFFKVAAARNRVFRLSAVISF